MKFIIVFITGFFSLFSNEGSFYDIEIMKPDGQKISMASFSNKKIIITAISTSNPDYGYLKYLNYLQSQNSSLVIIAVPAIDFGGEINYERVKGIRDSLPLNIIITQPGYIKKTKGNSQQILFKWLTRVEENSHFDTDVETTDQLYVISESGVLYAVLQKPVTSEVIEQVLKQQDIKN